MMEESIQIDNRDDFGLWAIELAKRIVADQGFELARAARDGSEDDVRAAVNALGPAITNALMHVFDGLMEDVSDDQAQVRSRTTQPGAVGPGFRVAALC